jgi:hypothetical protein
MNTETKELLPSLIQDYIDAKAGLARFKKLESVLRIELLDILFPSTTEGTVKEEIDGLLITGSFKIGHKIDVEALAEVLDDLSADELDCINYKATLSLANYKLLDENERSVLDEAIISKPAIPTITIKTKEAE